MIAESLIEIGFDILLFIPLYVASCEDIKYHRIDKKYVIAIFIIVMIHNMISSQYVAERTFSFFIAIGVFSLITFVSKGGFGFGDTLILGALGWYIGSLMQLRYFLLILVAVMLCWGAYFIITNRLKEPKKFKDFFKMKEILPINEIKPGMIMANDYFMVGLNEKDIEKLKEKGHVYLEIKKAYPFIPVILISFVIFTILNIPNLIQM